MLKITVQTRVDSQITDDDQALKHALIVVVAAGDLYLTLINVKSIKITDFGAWEDKNDHSK